MPHKSTELKKFGKSLIVRLSAQDVDIARALEAVPRGQREALIRQALRWYFVPGGFRDLMDQLAAMAQAGPTPAALSLPSDADPLPDRPVAVTPRIPPPTSIGDATDVPLDDLIHEPATESERQALADTVDAMLTAFGGDSLGG